MMIITIILSDVNFKVNSRRGRGGSAGGGLCCCESVCCGGGARCSLLTLAHSVKGLNEGFDGRSGLCVGVCVGDGGDAAPVTAAVRVRRPHRVSRGPGGHSGQGHRLYTVLGSVTSPAVQAGPSERRGAHGKCCGDERGQRSPGLALKSLALAWNLLACFWCSPGLVEPFQAFSSLRVIMW